MHSFLDTVDTIPLGLGFSLFGTVHLGWLGIFLVAAIVSIIWYRRLSENGKRIWKKSVALLIVLDEAFKVTMLIIGGRYSFEYLPLHLCSINIFLIAIHAWKANKILGGYLYTVGIPGAMAALLFPTWVSLPIGNFMHLHSFTIHILLALYPITLAAAGELSPQVKQIPRYLMILVCMAVPIYFINLLLDTNFMFLMFAEEGNPLYLFEQIWGSHLLGFPVLIVAVLVAMYLPMEIFRKIKSR